MAVAFATVVSVTAHADAKWDEGAPRIKGPKVYGATPGRTFQYTFPTCGSRKGLNFSVSDGVLPPGTALDSKTGVLSGRVAKAGEYSFEVSASNDLGSARKRFSLIIGNRRALTPPKEMENRLTQDELASHFALWAIIPTPLFLSCDIDHMDDFTFSLVTNDDLIEINQDYPAKPAKCEKLNGGKHRIWRRDLSDGRKVLAFFNLDDDKEWNISHSLGGAFVVRDVLEKADLGKRDSVTATLPIHAAKVYTIGNVEVK